MGVRWGAVHFRTGDRAAVLRRVERWAEDGRRALVGPALRGWVSVYPEELGDGPAKKLALHTRRALTLPPLPRWVSLCHFAASADGTALAGICQTDGGRNDPDYRLVVWSLADLHARCDALLSKAVL